MSDGGNGYRPTAIKASMVLVHSLAFVGTWITAVLLRSGSSDFGTWYGNGGFAMHLLVVISFLQAGVGIGAGLVQLRRPLPFIVHLAAPATAALIGALFTVIGIGMATTAVHSSSPELQIELWGESMAIAQAPMQLGYLIAGWGMLGAAATAGLYLATWTRFDAPKRPAIVFGLLALIVTCVTFVIAWSATAALVNASTLAVTALLVGGLLVCGGLAALGARGALAPTSGYVHAQLAATFSMAVLGAIAPVGWAMGVGGAVASSCEGLIYAALVKAAGAVQTETLAACVEMPQTLLATRAVSSAAIVTALVVAVLLLGSARQGLMVWLRLRVVDAILILLAVIALAVIGAYHRSAVRTGQAGLAAASGRRVPADVNLAISSEQQSPADGPTVVLRDERVILDGRPVGRVDVDATYEELGRRLKEHGEPAAGRHTEPEGAGRESAEQSSVVIAMGRWTLMSTAQNVARHLCASGNDRWQLVVRQERKNPWETEEGRQARAGLGPLGDFMLMTSPPNENAIDLELHCAPPGPKADPDDLPPELWVRFKGGELRVLGPNKPFVLAKLPLPAKGVDAPALSDALLAVKQSHPDTDRIAIDATEAKWWQDFVTTLDVARVRSELDGEKVLLFSAPVWVLGH